jgi:hypothetical protein
MSIKHNFHANEGAKEANKFRRDCRETEHLVKLDLRLELDGENKRLSRGEGNGGREVRGT